MPGPAYIRGERVDLRVVEEDDLPFLYEVVNDPRVWRPLGASTPQTMGDEEKFYEQCVEGDREEHFLVCDDGEPVGIVGVSGIDPDGGLAEVGYFLDPAAHGRGFATAAVASLVEYAFDHHRLAKVYADAFVDNEASRRVLEKNGFREEGRFRRHVFVDGERVDVVRYGLLADER